MLYRVQLEDELAGEVVVEVYCLEKVEVVRFRGAVAFVKELHRLGGVRKKRRGIRPKLKGDANHTAFVIGQKLPIHLVYINPRRFHVVPGLGHEKVYFYPSPCKRLGKLKAVGAKPPADKRGKFPSKHRNAVSAHSKSTQFEKQPGLQ